MSSDQHNRLKPEQRLALFFGTFAYLACLLSGIALITKALSGTIDTNTWFLIVFSGVAAAFLLLKFYDLWYFRLSINIAASAYFVISGFAFFAIHILTNPDFGAKLGLDLSDIPPGNKVHLWACLVLYAGSAFSILTLHQIYTDLSNAISNRASRLWHGLLRWIESAGTKDEEEQQTKEEKK